MKPTRNDLKNTIDECCCHLLNKRLNYTKEDAISEILKIHDQIADQCIVTKKHKQTKK
jgi:chorismate mutase